jgi:CBS domain-containing membrane protein
VEFGTPLAQAWALLHRHQIKALPVVDRWDHVVGIVTQADFLRTADLPAGPTAAAPLDLPGLAARLRRLLTPTPTVDTDKPEVVGQIMSRQVRVVSANRPVADLVPLFSSTGHHHIPVIAEHNKLVGIITQTDLVAALGQTAGDA